MKFFSKYLAIFLTALILFQSIGIRTYALVYPTQPEPEMLEVYPLHDTPPSNVQPPIGYNEFDGYYTDLRWNNLRKPIPADVADRQYTNIYLHETSKAYQPQQPLNQVRDALPGNVTQIRLNNLKSGTIYYAYTKAYYSDIEDGNVIHTSPESLPSNTVKFMTDIDLSVQPGDANGVRIIWDDVWNAGARINYRLFISESSDFSNTPPIYINNTDIGDNKPIKVDKDTGKLTYNYTVPDPGRVYFIKIVPDISDDVLKRSVESKTVAVASRLLVKTTKMAENDMGNIWRLDWTPVVTGLNEGSINITYQIYRGVTGSNLLPQYIAATNDTSFFLTLEQTNIDYYFIIRAQVQRNGQDVYLGIKIESEIIHLQESEIASQPAAPEIVNEIKNSFGDVIMNYEDQLRPDGATIFWSIPKTGSGLRDDDIAYDIWLLDNASDVDKPPENRRIESALKIGESRYVLDSTRIAGYKYVLNGLEPNSTYYFKICARKDFVDYVDGVLQHVTYYSQPSIKALITPAKEAIDVPVAPGRPPLKIKQGYPPEEKLMISDKTAVVQLKNKWYEHYNDHDNEWKYIDASRLNDIDPRIIPALESSTYEGDLYRVVHYDEGVTIDVGYVEYNSEILLEDIINMPADKVKAFPALPNDPDEDLTANPDGLRHNIDITLSGLRPNTTYMVWVRASRVGDGLLSQPSDPILFTTQPLLEAHIEKPVVPEINYRVAGDNYVDLGWNYLEGLNYYIKYAVQDDFNLAATIIKVSSQELMNQSYYRVANLDSDSLYYFWIQAEAVNSKGEISLSEWSSSYPVKTLRQQAPETPYGFGLKNIEDAVTQNSITFEWISEDGLEYILEIAQNIDYKDAQVHYVGSVSEYKADNLRSNARYYARLYAYDLARDLRSEPTGSISVRTLRSKDDYDSDEDVEIIPSGAFIEIDRVSRDGIWNAKITGIDAARFIEIVRVDKVIDYKVDLTKPPVGTRLIRLTVSGRVIKALSDLGENLIIRNPMSSVVIRPNTFGDVIHNEDIENIELEIDYILKPEYPANTRGVFLKTALSEISISVFLQNGTKEILEKFSGSLGVEFEYIKEDWYKNNTTFGAITNEQMGWTTLATKANYLPVYEKGMVMFEVNFPGKIAVIDRTYSKYTDIGNSRYRSSIDAISLYKNLSSIDSSRFYPDKELTLQDAIGISLDLLQAKASLNPMITGVRSNIIGADYIAKGKDLCSRELALSIAVKTYVKMQGINITYEELPNNIFEDINEISPSLEKEVNFMVKNGLVIPRNRSVLGPNDIITRGEFAAILEKILIFVGEL